MPAEDIQIPFPQRGVVRGMASVQPDPQATPDASNVIPYDVHEHRFRGGSRPGFVRATATDLGGAPVLLASFPSKPDADGVIRQSLVAATANGVFVNVQTEISPGVYEEDIVALGGILETEDSVATIQQFYLQPGGVDNYLQPGGGLYFYGTVDDAGLLETEDEEYIATDEFAFTGQRTSAHPYQGVLVVPGTGEVIAEGTGRLRFGIFTGDDIADWNALGVDTMRHLLEIQPLRGSSVRQASYVIKFDNVSELYVDSGTNRGRCSFRIVDGPKAIDASSKSVRPLNASIGNIPIGAELVSTYLDRLVFVDGRVWYMSRQGDPTDWDYGADVGDRGRAVAGVTSDAGQPGDEIIALASRGNDYLVMFARQTTWVMRGDPAAGGVLFNISRNYGCVDSYAFCHGDEGEIYFLSKEGLCVLADGVGSRPTPISSEALPNELRNFDASTTLVSLAFDVRYRGVWIFLTPKDGSQGRHWWYSKLANSFWPIQFASSTMQPTAATVHSSSPAAGSVVTIGDASGVIRQAIPGSGDGATLVDSNIILGPYLTAGSAYQQGLLTRLVAMFGPDSGVALDVFAGDSPDQARLAAIDGGSPKYTVNLSGQRTAVFMPRVRSVAFCLRLRSNTPWSFESLMATIGTAGQARL